MMRKVFSLCLILMSFVVNAQQNPEQVNTLKAKLSKAKTSAEKVEIMGDLARMLMNTSIAEADEYGILMKREAEVSRDRKLIVKALMINGERYSYFRMKKDFLQKAIDYTNQALEIARNNKLDKETAEALLQLSSIYTAVPDLEKSFNYTTQASSINSYIKNDSLSVATYYSFGGIYQLKKERILALRNYLNALTIAEEIKNHLLLRSCYSVLSQFYADIKDYDKAIDYAQKASKELAFMDAEIYKYNPAVDLYLLGNLYMMKKDFDMSAYYFERSIKTADSLKYPPLKMPGYNGLLNQYIRAKQPEKALAYFNSQKEMKDFIMNFGISHVIDNAYGVIYSDLGRYDSAQYYFAKATPGIEAMGTPANKLSFYFQYADFYEKSGNTDKAIEYYLKTKAVADQTSDLEWQQRVAQALDSAYLKTGDYMQARMYNGLYHQYKDSLQKLGEEKDLLQMELNNEQLRQERIAKELAEKKKARHNIQYLGITIGIAFLFVIMVMMGMFKVSASTIRVIGFFSFLMLFEFIFLVFKKNIYGITQGEPWKDLAFMILIAAVLIPLHHKLEHKVVHYLVTKKRIASPGKGFWLMLLPKRKPVDQS